MKKSINHSWLTAKDRDKVSYPTRWLLSNGYLKGDTLDFGCGHGVDVEYLSKNGVKCIGYDKYHRPAYPQEKFDRILCVYVLNVLEQIDQAQVLMEISEMLCQGGKAYFAVRRDLKHEGFRVHKIHKKTTYQCNVVLPYRSILKNDFCEIYEYTRITDQKRTSDCIFCRPAASLEFITESATAFAVYDGYPVSEGHALVIPKKHVSDYFDLSHHAQEVLWIVVNRVKQILDERYHPDGYNVGFNIGPCAGQTVFHVHIHIIPRYIGDMDNPRGGVRHVIPSRAKY